MKRLLVTGSRTWTDYSVIRDTLYMAFLQLGGQAEPITLVHGGAKGADMMAGEIWSRNSGMPVEVHRAMWEIWGKKAGRNRNEVMVSLGADLCLAFIKDSSAGASHCAAIAEAASIPVRYFREVSNDSESEARASGDRDPVD
jgi:YspA, cpYpsA-related SLOG family